MHTFPADRTVVLLLPGMVPAVHGEVGRGAEPLPAVVAGEQFLAGVLARVHAQLRPGRAALQADLAHKPNNNVDILNRHSFCRI